jgi:hypothetical protein
MTRVLQATGEKGRDLLLDGKPMHEAAVVNLVERLIPPIPGIGREVRGIYIDGVAQYDITLFAGDPVVRVVRVGPRTPQLEADYAALDEIRARDAVPR